ncbi:hypothetical protein D3C84_827320 [compost metagenome]
MEAVVIEIFKVNQAYARALGELVVESLAEVFVIQQKFDFSQQTVDVIGFHAGVDLGK